MRVKDSYLLEKQKQLGEFFSEDNWEGKSPTEEGTTPNEGQEKEESDDEGVTFEVVEKMDDESASDAAGAGENVLHHRTTATVATS